MSGDKERLGVGGLVVILTRDPELTRALPMSLWRLDTSIQVQVVSTPEEVRDRPSELAPAVVVVDGQAAALPSILQLVASDMLASAPVILLDREIYAERRRAALEAGVVAYLGGAECAADSTAVSVVRVLRTRLCVSRTHSPRHYEDIIEASSDGIFVLVEERFHFVNQAFTATLGKSAEELAGSSLLDFVLPEARARVAEDLSRVASSAGVRDLLELSLRNGAGQMANLEVSCRASVVEGRRALVGVARDVTAIQQLEHEIERARKRAAQVERLRALGELAAGVAHDFNNTIGTVLGRVELVRQKLKRQESVHEDIEVIEAAAKNAAAVVKRVQEFARPAGSDTWQDIDLGVLVRDALALTATQVPPHIKLKVEVGATPIIQGNGAELREVILNLLRNAFDAIDKAGEVIVRSFTEDGKAVLVVEDTGQGIPAAVQQRIFEPFFTTKGERGTGLGLSVSHWILRRHDAQIHLQSEPGQGTVFRLVFAPFTPRPRSSTRVDKDKLTILVVDDDQTVADVIHDLLCEEGHDVIVVNHPSEAAQILGQRSADLMITDLDLPGMSGWQLASKVREIQPNILVGLVTGWALGASEQELRARGVDFVLAKPFSADSLEQAVALAKNPRG